MIFGLRPALLRARDCARPRVPARRSVPQRPEELRQLKVAALRRMIRNARNKNAGQADSQAMKHAGVGRANEECVAGISPYSRICCGWAQIHIDRRLLIT